ncbi:MAG TPA: hypothetical protein PK517_03005 [Nitrosomonas sp.]|nr:hypothetical protein [Nitrosomonas sp.]
MLKNENALREQGTFDTANNTALIITYPDAEENNSSPPNFGTAGNKTNKTDETDLSKISNAGFITGIFGDIVGSERPIVVSFSGDPNKVGKSAWFGKHWIAGKTSLPDDSNNYTSFATFKPDDEGKYRRQKKQFVALYAVMLDDVGVKVDFDRITLEPSWKIETSSGNFQIGFILEEPIIDPAKADNLLNSIIEAGLCDLGSSAACALIMRPPCWPTSSASLKSITITSS